MNIAYVRVSTMDQNEERQKEALKKHKIDKWFIEKVSAKDKNRPELTKLLDFAREDDKIFIHDLSRLARSTKDLLEIIELLKSKKIELFSNKESIDTTTATGKLMLTMIGAIYEFERANLLERQKEGILIAKKKGKYKGRKKIEKPEKWEEEISKYKTRQATAKDTMKKLGLKKNIFYKFLREEK